MKKLFLLLLLLVLIGGAVAAWIFLGPGTSFSASKETLYIRSKSATKKAVLDSLEANEIIGNNWGFTFLADRLNYWENIRPGKYEIPKGTSLLTIVRMLRNGRQTPVQLVVTKIRTKEDFARLTGNRFEFDSTEMIGLLNDEATLAKWNVDTANAMSLVIPDSYTYFWTASPEKVMEKLVDAQQKFWNSERKQKAEALGLKPAQVYTLASIVEEETTNNAEKGNVASVYLNRLNKGMPLQADPTIKFAMRNFALTRIYEKYLFVASPYNTYRNKGLPPGPICTPSQKSIDAVLNAPNTDYIYFVADPTKRETHDFSVSYEEHLRKARVYQQALNRRDSLKAAAAQ